MKEKHIAQIKSMAMMALTGTTILQANAQAKEKKPLNIVYIMTDDHTAQMMSCYDKRYMQDRKSVV